MQIPGARVRPRELDRVGCGPEALQHRDEGVERVRKNIDGHVDERARACTGGARLYRPEREVAVRLHERAQLGAASDQRFECTVAKQLMARADESLARAREIEERARIGDRQRKRLLDVDVRAAIERRVCGLEVGGGRRADVHDVGPGFRNQRVDGGKGGCPGGGCGSGGASTSSHCGSG